MNPIPTNIQSTESHTTCRAQNENKKFNHSKTGKQLQKVLFFKSPNKKKMHNNKTNKTNTEKSYLDVFLKPTHLLEFIAAGTTRRGSRTPGRSSKASLSGLVILRDVVQLALETTYLCLQCLDLLVLGGRLRAFSPPSASPGSYRILELTSQGSIL